MHSELVVQSHPQNQMDFEVQNQHQMELVASIVLDMKALTKMDLTESGRDLRSEVVAYQSPTTEKNHQFIQFTRPLHRTFNGIQP